jgi:lysophospholipase L1-like esterase
MKQISLILIFLAAGIFMSCKKSRPQGMIIQPPVSTGANSFLAIGDSYTIGQSVAEADRFPNLTADILRAQGKSVGQPKIIATTGWTTADLLNALNANPPANNYNIVTLLIGVNNQYQGRSIEEYKSEFTQLLVKAIGYAGGNKLHVFVVSIPDYSVTPFAQNSDTARIAMEIDLFNNANRQIAAAYGVAYLNITTISREGRNDNTLHASDGLHPSGKQYRRWSDLLAPMIASTL